MRLTYFKNFQKLKLATASQTNIKTLQSIILLQFYESNENDMRLREIAGFL